MLTGERKQNNQLSTFLTFLATQPTNSSVVVWPILQSSSPAIVRCSGQILKKSYRWRFLRKFIANFLSQDTVLCHYDGFVFVIL